VLTFRGQSPAFYRPDPDIHFENIFHPFDPLVKYILHYLYVCFIKHFFRAIESSLYSLTTL
jgi:hypothetical protein